MNPCIRLQNQDRIRPFVLFAHHPRSRRTHRTGRVPSRQMLRPGRARDPETVLILQAQGFRFSAVLIVGDSRAWFVRPTSLIKAVR